jgi:hypothetical protein
LYDEAELGIRLSSCAVNFSSSISVGDNAWRSGPTGIVQPLNIAASIHEFPIVDTRLSFRLISGHRGEYGSILKTKKYLHFSISLSIPVWNAVCDRLFALDWFLVCLEIEIDEKDQVTGKKQAAKNGRIFCSSTVGNNWEGVVIICSNKM